MKHIAQYVLSRPLVMAIMVLGLSCVLSAQQKLQPSKKAVLISVDERRLFDLLNQARRENGLSELRWNEHLATAAHHHAVVMAERNELSHRFPDESPLQERMADAGAHFSTVAENVGFGPSTERIHDLLMHSSGHRANILEPGSNEVGIAVVRSVHGLFAVQDFAHTVPDLDAAQQTALVATLLQREGYTINTEHNAARSCDKDDPNLHGVKEILHFETSDLGVLPDVLRRRDTKERFRNAAVASCKVGPQPESSQGFVRYRMVVLLY